MQNSVSHLMTWFETIRSRITRVTEQQFLSKPLRQFQGRAENVALRIREFFLRHSSTREASGEVTNIGKSIFVKGELGGDEDLIFEGRMEGKIALKDHNLVIGPNGKINAQVNAKNVIVMGRVVGNIRASRMVEIRSPGSVVGDINSARISTEDGACFKGSVNIQRKVDNSEEHNSPHVGPAKSIPNQSSGKIG